MAGTKKGPQKAPRKAAGPAKVPSNKTTTLARKLAAAVIEEYGLPKEIAEKLLAAGVPQTVIDRVGGAYNNDPHTNGGYKRPKK